MRVPVKCYGCGATGNVGKVTAGLRCKCGSRDLDVNDEDLAPKTAGDIASITDMMDLADTQSTEVLVASLVDLDESTAEGRMAAASIIQVLEGRVTGLTPALDAWVEEDAGRTQSQVVLELMKSSSLKTALRVPAYGPGEYTYLDVPEGAEGRVMALSPFMTYGPDYSRVVKDTLIDMSDAVRIGNPEIAEWYLTIAEAKASRDPAQMDAAFDARPTTASLRQALLSLYPARTEERGTEPGYYVLRHGRAVNGPFSTTAEAMAEIPYAGEQTSVMYLTDPLHVDASGNKPFFRPLGDNQHPTPRWRTTSTSEIGPSMAPDGRASNSLWAGASRLATASKVIRRENPGLSYEAVAAMAARAVG